MAAKLVASLERRLLAREERAAMGATKSGTSSFSIVNPSFQPSPVSDASHVSTGSSAETSFMTPSSSARSSAYNTPILTPPSQYGTPQRTSAGSTPFETPILTPPSRYATPERTLPAREPGGLFTRPGDLPRNINEDIEQGIRSARTYHNQQYPDITDRPPLDYNQVSRMALRKAGVDDPEFVHINSAFAPVSRKGGNVLPDLGKQTGAVDKVRDELPVGSVVDPGKAIDQIQRQFPNVHPDQIVREVEGGPSRNPFTVNARGSEMIHQHNVPQPRPAPEDFVGQHPNRVAPDIAAKEHGDPSKLGSGHSLLPAAGHIPETAGEAQGRPSGSLNVTTGRNINLKDTVSDMITDEDPEPDHLPRTDTRTVPKPHPEASLSHTGVPQVPREGDGPMTRIKRFFGIEPDDLPLGAEAGNLRGNAGPRDAKRFMSEKYAKKAYSQAMDGGEDASHATPQASGMDSLTSAFLLAPALASFSSTDTGGLRRVTSEGENSAKNMQNSLVQSENEVSKKRREAATTTQFSVPTVQTPYFSFFNY